MATTTIEATNTAPVPQSTHNKPSREEILRTEHSVRSSQQHQQKQPPARIVLSQKETIVNDVRNADNNITVCTRVAEFTIQHEDDDISETVLENNSQLQEETTLSEGVVCVSIAEEQLWCALGKSRNKSAAVSMFVDVMSTSQVSIASNDNGTLVGRIKRAHNSEYLRKVFAPYKDKIISNLYYPGPATNSISQISIKL